MPDYSMKAKRHAWQRAKEAADAVEAAALGKKGEDAAGGAACQERLLLDRLRDENHTRSVVEAWLRIEQHLLQGLGAHYDVGPVRSRPVIALTQTAATILAPSGASLMYHRHNKPAPARLGDSVDDISGARA